MAGRGKYYTGGKGKTGRRVVQRKRPFIQDDCESVTSPENNQKKDPSIVLISSSHEETDGGEMLGETQPQPPEKPMNVEEVTDHFNSLNSNMEEVLFAVGMLSQAWMNSTHKISPLGTPISDNLHTGQVFTTPSLTTQTEKMMIETESILRKFMKSGEKNSKSGTPVGNQDSTVQRAKGLVRKLFSPPEANQDPQWVPTWLSTMFGVRNVLKLTSDELAVAVFIFKNTNDNDVDLKEELVKTDCSNSFATRLMLGCLKPKEEVEQEILNLVVCKLTHKERKTAIFQENWFLPTTFAQYVLSWSSHPNELRRKYKEPYMGEIDMVSKIFVPVNDSNMHWYLIVIDIRNKQLVYLDSYPTPDRIDLRVLQTKILAVFMEQMFSHKSFYQFKMSSKPKITQFKIIVPAGVGVQKDYSNDCGIWVAEWMSKLGKNNYIIEVDDGARLRLALDLVLHPYNTEHQVVLSKSLNYVKHCKEPTKKT